VNEAVVVVGMGQLGRLFSEGFLQLGEAVIPVLRGQSLAARLPSSPRLLFLAVGEEAVGGALDAVPDAHLDRVVLIQNELRPDVWAPRYQGHSSAPTVGIVWFERKLQRPPHVVLPSVLHGPVAPAMSQVLARLGLPARTISGQAELHHQLALKNLYILGLNFAGLSGFQRAKELLDGALFWQRLVDELIGLEQASLNRWAAGTGGAHPVLDRLRLKADLNGALAADPEHACAGRSAGARLVRTLSYAEQLAVQLVECRRIAHNNKL